MRRFLLRLLVVTAALSTLTAIVLYGFGGWLLARATRKALPQLVEASSGSVGKLRRIVFENAQIRPWTEARWINVAAEALPPPTPRHPSPTPIRIRIAAVTARLAGTSPLRVNFSFEGFRIDSGLSLDAPQDVPFGSDEFDVPLEKVDAGFASLSGVAVSPNPGPRMREELAALHDFLREGTTTRDLRLDARLHFRLHDVPMSVRLETHRSEGISRLRINRNDLNTLSRLYSRPLTLAERDLIAANPVKAPVLLRIKEYSERAAHRLAARDSAYNEDSTRHVLWSFWLARTYGPVFAEKVTEAHEIGSDNTPLESARDRSNNALGRAFADTHKTEGQVVHLVRTDSRVAR